MFVVWAGKPRDSLQYDEARGLREDEGMPFKRIAAKLGISVATAHLWTCDIPLTPDQIARNLRGPSGPHSPERLAARTEARREKAKARRLEYQQVGRMRARQGDALHEAGCMLYWAEGSKDRNTLTFANSDVHMVRFFWRFLRNCFATGPEQVTIRLNVYTGNGMTIQQIQAHWLKALDLPSTCLCKPLINHFPTSSSGTKKNKLPYGVCTFRVLRSTPIVQHMFGAIQEYARFDEPRWLDGPPRKPRLSPLNAGARPPGDR